MAWSPASIIYATATQAMKYIVDGSDYLLGVAAKIRNAAGTIVNPSTEETLSDVDTKLGTIDSVLDSIKDTDGIKKITDQLPAGTNEIGEVAQGTKAAGADAWPQVLYDTTGNPIAVILDDTAYLLRTASKTVETPDSDLDYIQSTEGGGIKVVTYDEDGSVLATEDRGSATVPRVFSPEQIDFLRLIYGELRKINNHLTLINEEEIKDDLGD